MTREPTNTEKLRGLPWSIGGNAANTFYVQFTFFGSVFVLFLRELGMNMTQIGSLLSLFPFFNLVAPLVAAQAASFGYKRTFVLFFGLRKIITILLLLIPWMLFQFGDQATILYVAAVVTLFAFARAIAETAFLPWVQEFVPNAVRGKYSATDNIFTTLAGLIAVSVAGYVVGSSTGLTRFMVLVAVGVAFGLLSTWAYSHVPGGASTTDRGARQRPQRELGAAWRDRNFLSYLFGVSLIVVATVPMFSFLPLFMQEQVKLSEGHVVLLQTGGLIGGLLSGYLWGWAADRYGSKPVMLSGLTLLLALPVAWLLMPRSSPLSLPVALGIALVQGIANLGWAIGSARLLFVSIVPPEKKMDYMAFYYAWVGAVAGLSQLLGGGVLDLAQSFFAESRSISLPIPFAATGQAMTIGLDPYTPLFVSGLILTVAGILLFRGVRPDNDYSAGQFAGLFLKGNPFLAAGALIRYNLARDEHATVSVTEQLGQSRSPLTVDELLEALADPRFNVRFEAIISMARMQPDERLIRALVHILRGREPALSVIAAWALGRIGNQQALAPLREGLDSHYRSIQAHSARALATLADQEIVPVLMARLDAEPDQGLRLAYASALGQLRAGAAVDRLLELLYATEDEGQRMELGLALARMVGDEHHFIQLLRHMRTQPDTTTAQAVAAVGKRLDRLPERSGPLRELVLTCAGTLARADLESGARQLAQIVRLLPPARFSTTSQPILAECALRLEEFGAGRVEYILLALHTATAGWQS